MKCGKAFAPRFELECRKGLEHGTVVERSVAVVRHRAASWAAPDGDTRLELGCDDLCKFAERRYLAGHGVRDPVAAVKHDEAHQLGDGVDGDVIAPLFPIAKQDDVLPFHGESAEAVGTVAVVRV